MYREDIINGIATAFHATNWADRFEEFGGSLSGCEILTLMDPITKEALQTATEFYERLETRNEKRLSDHFEHIRETQEIRSSQYFKDAELFGYYLGMEALGHGVSWTDDHDPHDLIVPYTEFYEELTFEE